MGDGQPSSRRSDERISPAYGTTFVPANTFIVHCCKVTDMIRRTSLALATLSLIASCGGGVKDTTSVPPQTTPIVLSPVTAQAPATTTSTTSTTTTTTTTEVPLQSDPLDYIDEQRMLHGRCGEWHDLAMEVGWQEEQWPTLSAVMFRESRCQPDACSKSDKGRPCRDYGLIQGNWYAHHEWWAELGITPEQMFDPATNLRWAYLLYSGREAKGQCGWQPWSKPCN